MRGFSSMRATAVLAAGLGLAALAAGAMADATVKEWKKMADSERLSYHGFKYLEADASKKAVKYFEKAAKEDPANPSAVEGLGDTWSALGQADRAKEAWGRADQLTGGKSSRSKFERLDKDGQPTARSIQNRLSASANTDHAYAAAAKGDFKYAVELFKAALAVDAGYWNARKGIDLIVSQGLDKDQTLPSRAGKGGADKDDDLDKGE